MKPGEKEYKCFVVDDNKLDRLTTVSFVRKYSFLNITGVFDNAAAAFKETAKDLPDVVMLDIDMPGSNGLDLRLQLGNVPACIFITAYPEYALQSFDVNALDFLIKPLAADRFDRSMNRLHCFLEMHSKAGLLSHSLEEENLFIKDGREHINIRFYDIVYLEALKDYTRIVTGERKYCVLAPLGNLLREKHFQSFIRIHRSYAVQKRFVSRITSKTVLVNDIVLPVGRSYKEVLDTLLS
jgi:two-component system LytT family response regulator